MKLDKDTIFWDSEEVSDEITGTWRWGTTHYRVFLHEGVTYGVTYSLTPEEGITDYDEPFEVKKVEETVVRVAWVKV